MNIRPLEKTKTDLINEFEDYFKSGFKTSENLGMEYEKIAIRNKDFRAVEFFFENGIFDFLTKYKEKEQLVPVYEKDFLLGLVSNNGTITLEPGCQVEYSVRPHKNISDIERELNIYNEKTSLIAQEMGISFLATGLQPLSTYENIKIIPKTRYEFMTKYLIEQASMPYVMMRETAGIQLSIDYKNEEDAIQKLSCALKLSPFLSALFANSPIRNGKLSDYKSFRAHAWLNTDNKRCGLISKKLLQYEPDFSFKDYMDILFDVPMIFNNDNYVGDKTFREFFNENDTISLETWKTHLSLFFTDVRLKNYIEIRNHDCQKSEYALSIPALYKGIMYSNNGITKVKELLKDFNYFDYEFIRQNAPRFGINFKIKNIEISHILKEIIEIAKEGLKEFNNNEDKYIEPISELIKEKITPADIIIKNFEGSWNKNIKKFIEYSKI